MLVIHSVPAISSLWACPGPVNHHTLNSDWPRAETNTMLILIIKIDTDKTNLRTNKPWKSYSIHQFLICRETTACASAAQQIYTPRTTCQWLCCTTTHTQCQSLCVNIYTITRYSCVTHRAAYLRAKQQFGSPVPQCHHNRRIRLQWGAVFTRQAEISDLNTQTHIHDIDTNYSHVDIVKENRSLKVGRSDLENAFMAEEEVGCLEVAVDDPVVMEMSDAP